MSRATRRSVTLRREAGRPIRSRKVRHASAVRAILRRAVGASCGYCDGVATFDADRRVWTHAADGARVAPGVPGDYVTDRHNRAGTVINPADLYWH